MLTVQDQIVRDIEINAPIEKVWDVITQAEHLGSWFGDAGASVDFQVGGEMMLRWDSHGEVWCRIDEIDAPHRFAWSWSPGGSEKPKAGNSTQIVFTLEQSGPATKLRVVESGFSSLEMSSESQAKHVEENTGGWKEEIDELKAYVENLAD